MAKVAPYGTWESPITADAIVENSASVDDVIVDPVTSTIYHIEKRPRENGRNVLVKTENGTDLFGSDWNCRTGVHEYGGDAATAFNGKIYFSNFGDHRVYEIRDGAEPRAVTPESKVLRYASFAVHPKLSHLIVAIQEDHTNPAPADVVNRLCLINTETQSVSPLVTGADFYAAPGFSPDGSRIIWQQWFHPDMPWEGAEICVANISANSSELSLSDTRHIAGKKQEISASYPMWISNDIAVFTSDESGYQNPWTYTVSSGKASPALQTPVKEDFSLPMWSLGGSYGASLDPEGKTLLFTAVRDGRSVLYAISIHSGTLEEIKCPYVSVGSIRAVTGDAVVFIGAKADAPPSIVLCTLKDYSLPKFEPVVKSSDATSKFSPAFFSSPVPITLGIPPHNDPLHVVYYPPTNPSYKAPDGEKPPCVVNVHGGPTSFVQQGLNLTTQFFTSRGWGWLDVNYGGSCGYGREYTKLLQGKWGVVDLRDCAISVSLLAEKHNLIDSSRATIRGRSSGGYTVLATLCAYPDVFAAGASHFGISDLKKLCEFTHKFESRYCETLIGGTLDEAPQVYEERSPINNADKIKAPLLVLQGSIDAVVPPEQAEDIVNKIKSNGGVYEYVLFEGEGHGWRKAENIKAALEKELSFYEKIFKLKQN